MTTEQIKAEIDRRINEDYNGPDQHENEIAQGALASLRFFINSIPEEKSSEDLEKAAASYSACGYSPFDEPYEKIKEFELGKASFIEGANWQKEQMEKRATAALAGFAKVGITLADLVAYDKGVAEGRRMQKEETDKKIQDAINYANKCFAQSIEDKDTKKAHYWDGGGDCLMALQRDIKED